MRFRTPILTGVDNVFVSPNGEVYVAEDTGDMQIVALSNTGQVIPILQVEISGSEICGPALSPDGTRLYFSSQRNPGTTFEISGPWLESIDTSSEPVSTLGLVGSGLLATDFAAWGARRARSRN
ncbi:MAG: alkaline phosphatase PhoX [Pseudomonadota bacterium]